MTDDLEPLSDDVKAALADERRAPMPATHRLQKRLAVSALALSASTAAGSTAAAGFSKLVVAAVVTGALATGVGGGVLLVKRNRPLPVPAAEIVSQPAPEPAVEPDLPAETADTPEPEPTPGRPPHKQPARAERDARLAAENALLETARAALASNRPTEALEALELHGRRFKRPLLGEERDALRIRAEVVSGHAEQARELLARFEHRYPESPLLPALRKALVR